LRCGSFHLHGQIVHKQLHQEVLFLQEVQEKLHLLLRCGSFHLHGQIVHKQLQSHLHQ